MLNEFRLRQSSVVRKYTVWLIIISVVSAVFGLVIDAGSFVTNILAGIVTAALGVWVAVVIVDGILRSNREREWRNVQSFAINAIHQTVLSISTSFNGLLQDTSFLADIMKAKQSQGIDNIHYLRGLKDALEALDQIPPKERLLLLYDQCSPDMDRMRNVVLPTVTTIGEDLMLVSLLQLADSAAHDWRLATLRQKERGVSSRYLFDCGLSTFATLIALGEHIADKPLEA